MPRLAPPTLTAAEQKKILRVTAVNVRDPTIFSMALGNGLRLAEIVGLNVGDVYTPEGTTRVRLRVRKGVANGGRPPDALLPVLDPWVEDFDVPPEGKAQFALVTGVQNGTEWSLGTDSDGTSRPNANPCP